MKEAIIQAVAELGAIPGFPQDEDARAAVMRALGSFIADPRALRFVVDRTVAQIGSAALGRTVRRSGLCFVAVTCHDDVEASQL